jgi:hypothetical protein
MGLAESNSSLYFNNEPRDTRPKLIAALRQLETKRDTNPPKKHGNIPLVGYPVDSGNPNL